jgi:hypothetical protein
MKKFNQQSKDSQKQNQLERLAELTAKVVARAFGVRTNKETRGRGN